MGFSGPTCETPAETRVSRTMGTNATSTSAVLEAIVAIRSGMEVLGIPCITSLAASMWNSLNRAEIAETVERVKR